MKSKDNEYNEQGLLVYEETTDACIYREYDEHKNLLRVLYSGGYGYYYSYSDASVLTGTVYFTFNPAVSQIFKLAPGTYTASAQFRRNAFSDNSRARVVVYNNLHEEIAESDPVICFETDSDESYQIEQKNVTFVVSDNTCIQEGWTLAIEFYYEDGIPN